MSAKLQPLGILKSYLGDLTEASVDAGLSVRQAISEIGINPDLVAGVFVNGEQESKDYILKDGDIARLLAVIGGG
jgi:sulfur carrier protein ThiS